MRRQARIQIDREAMQHNLRRCRMLAPDSLIMAVIKGNAYGHDMVHSAETLSHANAFAVSSIEEAIELRHAGFIHPILVLHGFLNQKGLKAAVEHRLRVVIHDWHQLELLDAALPSLKVDAALQLDTGTGQLGLPIEQAPSLYDRLTRHPNIKLGCWLITHLACADDPANPHNHLQLQRFGQYTQGLQATRSIASSAAILTLPEAHANWIRPGTLLYGSSPLRDESAQQHDLRATMTLSAPLIAIHRVRQGESVGQGASWICPQDTVVGVVACGYADGYPRHTNSQTPVWVNGKETLTLGRVSMDHLAIDLSTLQAAAGDSVELWGKHVAIDRIATAANTNSRELLCNAGNSCPHW